jgi:hypothetical protein
VSYGEEELREANWKARERALIACIAELEQKIEDLQIMIHGMDEQAITARKQTREEAAQCADNEPEPDDEVPEALAACEYEIRGAIRATKKSIAARIRALGDK